MKASTRVLAGSTMNLRKPSKVGALGPPWSTTVVTPEATPTMSGLHHAGEFRRQSPGGNRVRHVTVIGGGIVGVSSALALRREGHAVTLIERGAPGYATSFGNAGLLSVASCVPIATPGIVWRVPE